MPTSGRGPPASRPEPCFRDRFTGRPHPPGTRTRRDFAWLAAADELDPARVGPAFRERWGADLPALFTRPGPLLSPAALRECRAVPGNPGAAGGDRSGN
ncbi:hypothetical protein GCM10019016_031470 [Streptomyces prasinosporus]|uniref:Uncharacterized protein n=1 Tax=Streptomyces prasinosporus TaxID=68256 RepID=A0ABP6TPM9_9ACTN